MKDKNITLEKHKPLINGLKYIKSSKTNTDLRNEY